MVTKEELLMARKQREEAAARKEEKRQHDYKEWEEQILKQNCARATVLLQGELGKLLLELDAKNINAVWIGDNRCWTPDHKDMYKPSPLQFTPAKNYEPTQILLNELHKAGYEAHVEHREEEEYYYETYGDGEYRAVGTGRYEQVPYLVISW